MYSNTRANAGRLLDRVNTLLGLPVTAFVVRVTWVLQRAV